MGTPEQYEAVKARLLAEWLPEKPGGLKGLVEMAADAALEVLSPINRAPKIVVETVLADPTINIADTVSLPDAMYTCSKCDKAHRANSRIGKRHHKHAKVE